MFIYFFSLTYFFDNGGRAIRVFEDNDVNDAVGNRGFGNFDTGGVEVGFADDVIGCDVINTALEGTREFIDR